jgi:rubrerythrin
MPQTNPFHSVVPRKLTDTELARAIRLDMESELDAINLYAAHLDATDNEEAKAILRHIMDEEKEHAALFWQLIARLDPAQAGHAREASEKFRLITTGASHEAVEAVGKEGGGAGPGDESLPEPQGMEQRLTVGSFRR